ncbi:MAG: DNA-3-methyladenine glycosylase 2 family protein [Ruminococcaceae bacterium]|nr:DNA-3-methyladenine glycosylase 2 family protein [Oscillospiraceae bacterium]
MLKTEFKNNNTYIFGLEEFDLPHTLDCGQAFRWVSDQNGKWSGVAFGKYLELEKTKDGTIVLYNTTKEDYENIWYDYFDLSRNYKEIVENLSQNEVLKKACEYSYGIRVLNQEPFETLCSFIISQNNNIKRIKGIIERLCENFGEYKNGYYAFPTAEKIAGLTLEDLAVLRSGFRAKYLLDAAKKVVNGEVDLQNLKNLPLDEARTELMKIVGVGPKVADCCLLFSHRHTSAFPKDVWIKRAMEVLFNGELPKNAQKYAGIAQQYIFFYARDTKLLEE